MFPFATLRKIWLDTTTYENRYVAKDTRNAVAFVVGVILICASCLAPCLGWTLSDYPGVFLLTYSLGGTTLKEYFKYKNNAVSADCPNGSAPVPADSEPLPGPASAQ